MCSSSHPQNSSIIKHYHSCTAFSFPHHSCALNAALPFSPHSFKAPLLSKEGLGVVSSCSRFAPLFQHHSTIHTLCCLCSGIPTTFQFQHHNRKHEQHVYRGKQGCLPLPHSRTTRRQTSYHIYKLTATSYTFPQLLLQQLHIYPCILFPCRVIKQGCGMICG